MSFKNIMNLHLFDEGGDNGNGGQNAGSGNGGQGSTGGTFTYEQLDTLILTGFCENEEIQEKIEKRHAANLFKLRPMPEFKLQS